jgi:hypothetical protein
LTPKPSEWVRWPTFMPTAYRIGGSLSVRQHQPGGRTNERA